MAKRNYTTANTLAGAGRNLSDAKHALSNYLHGPGESLEYNLRSFVVFAYSVIDILKNLRFTEDGFQKWGDPYFIEQKNDPLLQYFYRIRNDIEHEGKAQNTHSGVHIKKLHLSPGLLLPPGPPNTKAAFIIDGQGRAAWEIQNKNGEITRQYFKPSKKFVDIDVTTHFQNPPESHLGQPTGTLTVEELCNLYLRYIEQFLQSAVDHFGNDVKAQSTQYPDL